MGHTQLPAWRQRIWNWELQGRRSRPLVEQLTDEVLMAGVSKATWATQQGLQQSVVASWRGPQWVGMML